MDLLVDVGDDLRERGGAKRKKSGAREASGLRLLAQPRRAAASASAAALTRGITVRPTRPCLAVRRWTLRSLKGASAWSERKEK